MSKAEKLAAKILSGKSDKNLAFNNLCYFFSSAPAFNRATGKEVIGFITKKEWPKS